MQKLRSHIAPLLVVAALTPGIVLAQTYPGFMLTVQSLFNNLVPLLISAAVIVFVWGIAKYVRHGGNPEKREEGRMIMVYGVIAIFVMVSLWGLVNLLIDTFFASGETTLNPSDVPQF